MANNKEPDVQNVFPNSNNEAERRRRPQPPPQPPPQHPPPVTQKGGRKQEKSKKSGAKTASTQKQVNNGRKEKIKILVNKIKNRLSKEGKTPVQLVKLLNAYRRGKINNYSENVTTPTYIEALAKTGTYYPENKFFYIIDVAVYENMYSKRRDQLIDQLIGLREINLSKITSLSGYLFANKNEKAELFKKLDKRQKQIVHMMNVLSIRRNELVDQLTDRFKKSSLDNPYVPFSGKSIKLRTIYIKEWYKYEMSKQNFRKLLNAIKSIEKVKNTDLKMEINRNPPVKHAWT